MKSYIGLALLGLAVMQVALIGKAGFSGESGPAPYRTLSVGDTVQALSTLGEGDHRRSLALVRADGKPTILLAFNSSCPHCESIAPMWRDWLQASRPAHVLAITNDSLSKAHGYRKRHAWNVELVSVAGAERYSPEHLLVSRVPWVAVFDKHGVLRLFEHGESLSKVDSLLGDLVDGTT
ncbi:MAG TPA: hypothetical protein VK399_04500 [Longimicrobiaceae bacterium]|nr:hypothetical protein [Longimicrobiaceae bacterium]